MKYLKISVCSKSIPKSSIIPKSGFYCIICGCDLPPPPNQKMGQKSSNMYLYVDLYCIWPLNFTLWPYFSGRINVTQPEVRLAFYCPPLRQPIVTLSGNFDINSKYTLRMFSVNHYWIILTNQHCNWINW